MLQFTFNPGLTLTGFRTTRPRTSDQGRWHSLLLRILTAHVIRVPMSRHVMHRVTAAFFHCSQQGLAGRRGRPGITGPPGPPGHPGPPGNTVVSDGHAA